jgi:hypothetical protein
LLTGPDVCIIWINISETSGCKKVIVNLAIARAIFFGMAEKQYCIPERNSQLVGFKQLRNALFSLSALVELSIYYKIYIHVTKWPL